MKVSNETIEYIAKLAKLNFSPEEIESFAQEFEHILNHFDNIEQEDITDIDLEMHDSKSCILRKDITRNFEFKSELFSNTRQMRDDCIVVPKVIE